MTNADSSAGKPQPGRPAAERPRAPASDADRERILALLREHYGRGNLDEAELDRRTGVALSARYTDEAAAAVGGLPLLTGQAGAAAAAVRRSRHRHAESDRPGPGWVPTSERFRDPASRMIMRVWVDPADDSRHYVPESPPP